MQQLKTQLTAYSRTLLCFLTLLSLFSLTACKMGPDYVEPEVLIPAKFKEAAPGWKVANPCDEKDRGNWWQVYRDPELSCLLERLEVSNENIKIAEAQYREAYALLNQARAAYFPNVSSNISAIRQQNSVGLFSDGSVTNGTTTGTTSGISTVNTDSENLNNDYSVGLTANWEPDIWGTVRRTVESNKALVQMNQAQLAAVKLSMQTTLVQSYYQLRNVDSDQKLLDDTVKDYRETLALTKNRYAAGVSYRLDVVQAETQLKQAEVQAINNRVNRALFEHAIAVLVGEPPACFSLAPKPLKNKIPVIPSQIPSELLERRPDIAAAERLVAASNAQIGVAIAAFYPTITLSGTGGYTSASLGQLFTQPSKFWSLGVNLAETLFDGGLRLAVLDAAHATYDQNVASYRQKVLTAFQAVEDNLATLHYLKKESIKQKELVSDAEKVLSIALNQYKSGTQAYINVIQAQISLFSARKNYIAVQGKQLVTSAALISALGGGWDKAELCAPRQTPVRPEA